MDLDASGAEAHPRGPDHGLYVVSGAIVHLGQGSDHAAGSAFDDFIVGSGGDDVIAGGDSGDYLFGGVGDDGLYGGRGLDALRGDAGDDWVWNLDGGDRADGGGGSDTLAFAARTWDGYMPGRSLVVDLGEQAVRIDGQPQGRVTASSGPSGGWPAPTPSTAGGQTTASPDAGATISARAAAATPCAAAWAATRLRLLKKAPLAGLGRPCLHAPAAVGRRTMMGRQVAQGALFYEFRLGDHVPADHLLRRIDRAIDLGFVREALAGSYSAAGRPSVDPELMMRMLLVAYLHGIRSERRLC